MPVACESVPAQRSRAVQRAGLLLLVSLCLTPLALKAQGVSLAGVSGDKALLVIDGSAPRFVATGQTMAGVKVLSVTGTQATVERDGQTLRLTLGEQPVHLTSTPTPSGRRVVMTADGQGHFKSLGSINGQSVTFLVDTGATWVALGQADAARIGLKSHAGQRVRVGTANGQIDGTEHQLDRVRLGDVEVRNVKAVVLPQPMPYVLLGNSFLSHFQMIRLNDQLTLERKP